MLRHYPINFISFAILCFTVLLSHWACCQEESTVKMNVFVPGVISLDSIRETSPSVTADGKTLVFARTASWKPKVPYIAHYENDQWQVERLSITDTLYNLAITPDGQRIIFKKYEMLAEEEISKTYVVNRKGDGWSEPVEVNNLYNINAGYFNPQPDGSLYFYARAPRPGIYYSEPDGQAIYTRPQWLSDAVSPEGTTSFDVLVHLEGDQLIITRAGKLEGEKADLGPRGYYYYQRTPDGWQPVKRLPLPYGWGATVLPNGRFLFVEEGDLQTISLSELGIQWNQYGQ